jgi:hypothetical protein
LHELSNSGPNILAAEISTVGIGERLSGTHFVVDYLGPKGLGDVAEEIVSIVEIEPRRKTYWKRLSGLPGCQGA